MELLIRSRPVVIAAFFVALGGVGVGAYVGNTAVMAWSGCSAHVCLFLFVATEAFGRVSRSRSNGARFFARVLFGMYVLAWTGLLASWLVAIRRP
jgi:hypothetical protein